MHLRGRITEEQKNYYIVDTDNGPVRASLKGVSRKQHARLYVGDIVDIELYNSEPPESIIRQLVPRKNTLQKPPVANIDQVLLICTMKEPLLDLDFVDRFLFACGTLRLPVRLVFNKCDLLDESETITQSGITALYEKIGYPCLCVSALTGENIGNIITHGSNALSIFAGQSGAGKTAILSRIFPDRTFRIGELSRNIQRGVHTTTSITLLKLPQSGYIADTPGFSTMELPHIPEDEVATFFPDIAANQGSCKFANCIHGNEPGCAIKEMVQRGEIAESRYANYLKIYTYMHRKNRDYKGMKRDSNY